MSTSITLLVVDDSEIDRHLVKGLLRHNPQWRLETAADGAEALARLAESPVDLIITDLQMPNVDGLELVRQVRARHSYVPVILMTAHGSEELAIEALECGAASYVPKSRLAEMLEDTISQVLTLAGSEQSYERLSTLQTRADFTFVLDNDPNLVDPLVDLIQQIAIRMGLCDMTGRYRIGVALHQALINAMFHGNLELTPDEIASAREQIVSGGENLVDRRRAQKPYRDRKVTFEARLSPERMEVKICDEGPGFDTSVAYAFDGDNSHELTVGRGLLLMKSFMDDVQFSRAGNEVLMIKHREPSAANQDFSSAGVA